MVPVAIRWVLIRDGEGKFEPQALLSTNQELTAVQIVEWFVMRWQLEVTFEEARRHLAIETQRVLDRLRLFEDLLEHEMIVVNPVRFAFRLLEDVDRGDCLTVIPVQQFHPLRHLIVKFIDDRLTSTFNIFRLIPVETSRSHETFEFF